MVKEAFEKNPQQQVAIMMIKKEKWPRDNSNPENTNSSNILHMSVTICWLHHMTMLNAGAAAHAFALLR